MSHLRLHLRKNLINSLQTAIPRGMPFDLAVLARIGASRKQAAYYVKHGWLMRVGQGVYAFPGDEITLHGATKLLQVWVQDLHVGGRSALDLQGVRQNLAAHGRLVLWGTERFALPQWFLKRFPAVYRQLKLFAWPNEDLQAQSTSTPPGVTKGLQVSVPERAALEMLYDVGVRQDLEEARNVFEGLRGLRRETVGRLLACCTSIKAVRLFLTWARETAIVDVETLRHDFILPVGSDKRWMTRLKDGTILSLKPYG
jgi:hypothetical protein